MLQKYMTYSYNSPLANEVAAHSPARHHICTRSGAEKKLLMRILKASKQLAKADHKFVQQLAFQPNHFNQTCRIAQARRGLGGIIERDNMLRFFEHGKSQCLFHLNASCGYTQVPEGKRARCRKC